MKALNNNPAWQTSQCQYVVHIQLYIHLARSLNATHVNEVHTSSSLFAYLRKIALAQLQNATL